MKTITRLLALLAAFPALAAEPTPSAPLDLRVAPERAAVHPKTNRDTILQIEVAAKPDRARRKVPLNLALVLDRSGSMSGAKIEKARQAAVVALKQLRDDDIFSLVTYDDEVRVLIPPQKVTDRRALERRIAAIEPGGSTALHAGVVEGAAQLRVFLEDERVNRVILLSDGIANVGPSSPADLARLGKSLRADGIAVSTIGLGDDYNEDLMTALAEASHANYYYVQDAEKLPAVFAQELDSAQGIAARKVRLRVRLAAGVEPVKVLGEEGLTFRDRTLEVPLEDLAAGQTRRFLVVCRVPADAADSQALGEATLDYVEPTGGAARQASAQAAVRIADSPKESDASVAKDVAAHAAITKNRLAKENAVKLADAGRVEDAAGALRAQAGANAALPASAQSPLLRQENERLLQRADQLLRTRALAPAERKALQYENYQDKKQKR